MKRHSHIISVGLMSLACFIAALEYYTGYQVDKTLNKDFSIYNNFSVDYDNVNDFAFNSELDPLPFNQETSPSKIDLILSQSKKISSKNEKILQVGKGDTISSLLNQINVRKEDIEKAVNALKKIQNVKELKVGQTIFVYFEDKGEEKTTLLNLEFKPTSEHYISLTKEANGEFKVEKKIVPLVKIVRRVDGIIQSSFYSSALKRQIPLKVVQEATKALSHIVNLQHGLKSGAPFELLYEEFQDKEGNLVKIGELKYISIKAGENNHRLFKFSPSVHLTGGYYNAKGESVVRTLLQTPIDARKMRITSKFQKGRIHPLKGFRRDHKGIDLGAPYGTAVMAAGDGIITKAGYFGDYGKFIKIKHGRGYETAYAHLSKISPNIKVGAVVRQGQVIGNVGATGLATGCHLHHEVIYNNVHIDPQNIKHVPSMQLAGKDLQYFQQAKKDIEKNIVGLPLNTHLVKKIAAVQPTVQ